MSTNSNREIKVLILKLVSFETPYPLYTLHSGSAALTWSCWRQEVPWRGEEAALLGAVKEHCLMGAEVRFCKQKKFWRSVTQVFLTLLNCTLENS